MRLAYNSYMVISYKASKRQKYHLSTVGILVNGLGQIGCHFFEEKVFELQKVVWENVYLLMSETVEADESLTESVLRGAVEECNAYCDVQHFLGSHNFIVLAPWGEFEKTVAFFVLRIRILAEARSNEIGATLKFLPLEELMLHMKLQRERGVGVGIDGLEGLSRYAENVAIREKGDVRL